MNTSDDNPVPQTRSQSKRWSAQARERLPVWVKEKALPVIEQRLEEDKLKAAAEAQDDKIFVRYDPLETGSGYVSPAVMLEFGARSTGEPSELHDVVCDAAEYLKTLEFPTAKPKTMKAERTFWEKATAIHVFCVQGKLKPAPPQAIEAAGAWLRYESCARLLMMAMLFARSREFSLEILPWQWVLRSDSTRPRDMASSNRRTAELTSSCTSLPSRRPATPTSRKAPGSATSSKPDVLVR